MIIQEVKVKVIKYKEKHLITCIYITERDSNTIFKVESDLKTVYVLLQRVI